MRIGHTADTGALRAGGATAGTAAIRRRHREPLYRPAAARSRKEDPFEQGPCMPTVLTGWDMPPLA